MAKDAESKRCPVCGQGILVDITYRAGPNPDGVEESLQVADSRQVETFSCGHEAIGPPLDRTAADSDDFEAERRRSQETIDPA